MDAKDLSRQLRQGQGEFLMQRRRTVALSLIASGAMGVISLYQTGVIGHLPEPPLPKFDADKVDASEEAYSLFDTPDAALGFANYGVTLLLTAMGGAGRANTQPWLPIALAVKAAGDALVAAKLTRDQWTKHRAFCFWCLVAAGATIATVPLTFPEARAAWRHLRRGA